MKKDPLLSWIPRHAESCVSRYRLLNDGRTPDQRQCGKTWERPVVEFFEAVHFRPVGENSAMRGGDQRMLRGVYVGHHERSGAAIFLTPDGVKKGDGYCENVGAREMGPRVDCDMCRSSLAVEARSVKSGKTCCTCGRGRSRCFACDCDACRSEDWSEEMCHEQRSREVWVHGRAQLALGMQVAKVPHDDRCRDRIGELMAEGGDQRHVERVSGTVRPGVEIPRSEAGEKVDVGEPTVVEEQQPTPTVRKANETNTDDLETKRVRFTESRRQKRLGEDEEEHHRRQEEEQHLDTEVEIPTCKTWRVEDVVGDAADAAPEQMNNFELSKTEVFGKIEESL